MQTGIIWGLNRLGESRIYLSDVISRRDASLFVTKSPSSRCLLLGVSQVACGMKSERILLIIFACAQRRNNFIPKGNKIVCQDDLFPRPKGSQQAL